MWRALALLLVPTAFSTGQEAKKPNLLLIFPDQWRWDWAGFDLEEADLQTPNLRSLADNGVRFTNAYTPSPWCAPARACLASGKFFDKSPQILNGADFDTSVPTWYQSLQAEGYHTILVGKDDLTQSLQGTGPDGNRNAAELGMDAHFRMQDKFVTFHEPAWDQFAMSMLETPCGSHESMGLNLLQCNRWCYGMFGRGQCCTKVGEEGYDCSNHFDQVGLQQENYIDDYVSRQAELLISQTPPGKPWALHLSYPGPHPPYILTEAMNRSVAGRLFKESKDNQHTSVEQQRRVRAQYAAEIENIDRLIGELIQSVKLRGELDNTIIVVTSDHGEQLGDNNVWGKRLPWEPSIHVPLIISGPGMAKGRVIEEAVSTLDVIGTFLDYAGATLPQTQARTLRPLLQRKVDIEEYLTGRPFVPVGLTSAGRRMTHIPPVDYRVAVKRLNSSFTIKVVCCPHGCPKGNSFVPSTPGLIQLLAFNVNAPPPADSLNYGAIPEALALAAKLPGRFAEACSSPEKHGQKFVHSVLNADEENMEEDQDPVMDYILSEEASNHQPNAPLLAGAALVVSAAAGLFLASKIRSKHRWASAHDLELLSTEELEVQ